LKVRRQLEDKSTKGEMKDCSNNAYDIEGETNTRRKYRKKIEQKSNENDSYNIQEQTKTKVEFMQSSQPISVLTPTSPRVTSPKFREISQKILFPVVGEKKNTIETVDIPSKSESVTEENDRLRRVLFPIDGVSSEDRAQYNSWVKKANRYDSCECSFIFLC
jgi:hypothetical protein